MVSVFVALVSEMGFGPLCVDHMFAQVLQVMDVSVRVGLIDEG